MTDIQKENKSGGKVPNLRFPSFYGDWEVRNLGEVADKITDGTHDTPKPVEDGVPFLTAIHVKDGSIDYENCYYLEQDVHNNIYKRCNPEKGDLLIVNIGAGTATCALNIVNYEFSLKNVALVKPNKSIIDGRFLAQVQRKNSTKIFNQLTSGGAQPFLSLKEIGRLPIKFPSLSEQKKISSFLSLIDERITTQSKIIKELKTLKASTAKKIFSQELRFKDDNGNIFSEWEVREVGEVFKITRGNVLAMNLVSNQCNEKNTYPVYSSQTKNNGLAGYYTDFLFEDAITWTTDGANAGDVNYRSGKFYCTNVCGVLISNEGYANSCIAEIVNSVSKNYVSYVGNPKLMNGVMSEIKIPFPSFPEQTKIANFLSAIDSKIDMENQLLQKLEEQKKYLLQNMFV